ncbi:MAG: cytochrome c3 family protein [Elusimicrobiota bacterium]|nr:cytochrome c3 family protein [Elusimicrobiota bacterium]
MAEHDWEKTDAFRNTEIPYWLLLAVSAAFVAAAWFFYSNRHAAGHGGPAFVVKPQYYDISPARTLKKRLETEGMACGDCHDPSAGPSSSDPRVAPEVHSKVVLKHGPNNRCFNCHNNAKRDFFAEDGGGQIPYLKVETLCRKCHGTTYRDWTSGTHGRRNGYWNKAAGEQKQLPCIACHDPHSPAFKPMLAAPAPRKYTAPGVKH